MFVAVISRHLLRKFKKKRRYFANVFIRRVENDSYMGRLWYMAASSGAGSGTINTTQAERVTQKSMPSDVLPLSRVLKIPLQPVL